MHDITTYSESGKLGMETQCTQYTLHSVFGKNMAPPSLMMDERGKYGTPSLMMDEENIERI